MKWWITVIAVGEAIKWWLVVVLLASSVIFIFVHVSSPDISVCKITIDDGDPLTLVKTFPARDCRWDSGRLFYRDENTSSTRLAVYVKAANESITIIPIETTSDTERR